MLQTVKNFLYDLIVWSGIINTLIPVLRLILAPLLMAEGRKSNHIIKDESGVPMKLTLLNGRLYPPFAEKIATVPDFRIRKDDVLLCGYPKTGCHWMHEIMHMLVNGKAELTKYGKELGGMIDLIPDIIIDSLPSPRVLNSHLLYEELPKGVKESKTKIVFTIRNPKDTLVSFYNHTMNLKKLYGYNGNFNDYFKLFIGGTLDYGSYFDYTLAWDKVIRNQDNPVLLVTFEEIKAEPVACVQRVAKFLGITITEQFARDVVAACEFSKMKAKREKAGSIDGNLFRKGVVGDWKNWLTDAQSQAIDRVWSDRMTGCLYQPHY